MRTSAIGVFFGFASLLALAPVAHAKDTWTKPFDGVKRLHRVTTNPNENVNAVVVDLTTPGVRFQGTSTNQRKKTTSSFAKLVGAQVAINGDFFSYATYGTSGLAAGAGAAWKDTKDTTSAGTFAFDKATKVELRPLADVVAFDPAWMEGVVSGHPWLVKAGALVPYSANSSFCTTRHPRTAIGITEDKQKVILAVVDGRSTQSVGMSCKELGTLMKDLGSFESMNFDGGGSSTIYVQGAGVVNVPSDGSERTVANHLAVFAPKSGSVGSFTGIVHEQGHPELPLEGATVAIDGIGEEVTDATGAYELSALPGTYTLTAKSLGYDSTSVDKPLAAGEKLVVNLELAKAAATDFDADGIPDTKDNCPKVSNANQLDNDGDALGDACDPDDDDDGVMDEDDLCPFVPGPDAVCPSTNEGGNSGAPSTGSGVRGVSSDASCSVGRNGTQRNSTTLALAAAIAFVVRRRTRRR